MLDMVRKLPNIEFIDPRPLHEIIEAVKSNVPLAGAIVSSGQWFNAENYDHLELYEAAFHAVAEEISSLLREDADARLAYDEITLEPIAMLESADVFCDFFYHWPKAELALIYSQEDKELNIDISLLRLQS